jgi:hypothetical protein
MSSESFLHGITMPPTPYLLPLQGWVSDHCPVHDGCDLSQESPMASGLGWPWLVINNPPLLVLLEKKHTLW